MMALTLHARWLVPWPRLYCSILRGVQHYHLSLLQGSICLTLPVTLHVFCSFQKVKHACRVKRADRWNNFLVEVNQELTVRETAELLK
jgi:hypothetical protein